MKRHPTPNNNLAPTQTNIPPTPRYLDNPEELILAAQKHFATAYPNERRAGCPAPGVIMAARADLPPGDELRAHLFRCSECFNGYSAALQEHFRLTAPDSAADWQTKLLRALSKWRAPMFAGVAASLLLVVSLLIQRRGPSETPQSSQTRSQPMPVASAVNPLTPVPPAPTAGRPPDPLQEKPRPAEWIAIALDLNRYRALGDSIRGGSRREEEKKIRLRPLRALLKLRLRRGSEAGLYRISVVDPNGNRLTGASARSRNGKSLDAVLDLRRAARMAHRLRVERGDDLNEYLIEISKP
jgi:hypothetical protein